MSAQKLKQLLQSEQIQQCADLAQKLLSNNAQDKVALFFLAQCQLKSGQLQECQNSLNTLYGLVQKGADDALLFNAYQCQEQLAIKLQESPQPKVRKTGRDIHISNKFQIVDFLDKKQKFDKMLEESETYCLLLLEDSRFKDIEDTYIWLMGHKGLTEPQKVVYGAKIFDIDQFYNPYTRLDALFPRLCKMDPTSPALKGLASKMLDVLDKQGGKKTVYAAVHQDQTIQQFVSYNDLLKVVGQSIFTSPQEIFKTKFTLRMFTRYLAAIAVTTTFLGEEWTKLESKIKMLLQSKSFESEDASLQVYLWAFIDVAKFVREARIPRFDELEISKLPLGTLLESLSNFSKEFQEYSQYVNAYFAIVAAATQSPLEIDASSIQAKIQQSQFICRKAQQFKLTPQKESSDLQLYLTCLLLKLPLDKEQAHQCFQQAELWYEKHQNNCSQKVSELFTGLTSELKWQADLKAGKWLQAIEGLDYLAKQNPQKVDFATVKKSKIQLCHLQEIVGDSIDKNTFLSGVMNSIQSVGEVEADNLLLQGLLMWSYPKLFECDLKSVLNKWLQALKKDQTNPEIYYALAVYYFKQSDFKRASGCLDKVLKLKPDFEQALVLSYQLAPTADARLALVDKFMETNRNVAVTYFFRGLLMHQRQDWFQAIEMYQNAIKFYGIQNSKQNYLLLPKVELSIFLNPFGIYGSANAAVCCVYLSECFLKIDKPQVALKCFTQGIEEMSKVKLTEQVQTTDEVNELIEIISLPQFQPNQIEFQTDPILTVLQNLQPSKWVLECLMLGARLVASPQTAISILNVALKSQPNQNMLGYILTELIAKVTVIVEQGVIFENGQVQLLAETPAVIDRLDKLIKFVSERPSFMGCQNLQKRRLDALFTIAQRTLSKDRFLSAMETAQVLYEAQFPGWQTLILDYAKIIHEYQRFDESDQSLQELKVTLIKKAIVKDPQQANLWVYLHMFSKEEFVRSRAIFKAYELEPESSFVQEMILKFYLQTKQWKKAFKIIVRSYQRATNAGEPQQPIVLATLAYINAVCYFETGLKAQLQEALSLIRLLMREDVKQLLSEVYVYLSHYNGDYMKTLSFLQSKPKTQVVDLLLLKAYFGSTILSYDQIRSKADENAKQLLNHVFEVDSVSDAELKQICEKEILNFVTDPQQVAPLLALHQELCLQRNISPSESLLDQTDVRSALQQLDTNSQRILLIQGLRLVQLRDGKIKETQAIFEDPLMKRKKVVDPQEQIETRDVSYTVFLLEAARLKPQYLSSTQHKALLRLYLKSKEDPLSFQQGIFNDQVDNIKNQAEIQGLKLFLRKRNEQSENGLSHLMKDPLSIEANAKWLWSLLKSGKVKETLHGFKMVESRIDLGILTGDRSLFDKLSQFIGSLTGQESHLESRLQLITNLCCSLEGTDEPESIDVRQVACRLIQTLSQVKDQTQDQLIQVIFQVLQVVLFEQGHYLIYNKLVKEILNAATVLHNQDLNSAYSKEARLATIWNYSLLQLASSLVQLKKVTQVMPLIKEIENLPKFANIEKPLTPSALMKARAFLAANNPQQVFGALQLDDQTLEKDYIQAISLYGVQEYSQYYLACLGIVAGAKSAEASQWDLAYAYYLKAFGEMTFLMAKRQGIKLKDDFTQSEGAKYNEQFFATKASTSLGKCMSNLESIGERDSMLWQAVTVMKEQI